jgi:hypothetical protein
LILIKHRVHDQVIHELEIIHSKNYLITNKPTHCELAARTSYKIVDAAIAAIAQATEAIQRCFRRANAAIAKATTGVKARLTDVALLDDPENSVAVVGAVVGFVFVQVVVVGQLFVMLPPRGQVDPLHDWDEHVLEAQPRQLQAQPVVYCERPLATSVPAVPTAPLEVTVETE